MAGTLFLVVGMFPLLVSLYISSTQSSAALGEMQSIATDSLEQQIVNQLDSVRDLQKASIESYFNTVRSQILTFSQDRMVIDAATGLVAAFESYRLEIGLEDDAIEAMRSKGAWRRGDGRSR